MTKNKTHTVFVVFCDGAHFLKSVGEVSLHFRYIAIFTSHVGTGQSRLNTIISRLAKSFAKVRKTLQYKVM
jgi:hypothetical protein